MENFSSGHGPPFLGKIYQGLQNSGIIMLADARASLQ
jgi:hypothetical protein